MEQKSFKILSIDGGGIRGIFPAMFLSELEAKLRADGNEKWQIYQNFDLVCGTSTGGIIAIALSLGIPAKEIYDLYIENASSIFCKKLSLLQQFFHSSYKRGNLESLIREKFKEANGGNDPRLLDCKIPTCIPIYDLMEGEPSILKSKYHEKFVRDYHMPAYQAALATSAAPTFFDPYSANYVDLNGLNKSFNSKVDGGVFVNNPTLTAIVEAQKSFNRRLSELKVLSIGTGHQKFCDSGISTKKGFISMLLKKAGMSNKDGIRNKWGLWYWIVEPNKKRLIELFMQGQSQQVQNLIKLLQKGIDSQEQGNFSYQRIDTELDDTCNIAMDETNKFKLEKLAEKATREFQKNASEILSDFFAS